MNFWLGAYSRGSLFEGGLFEGGLFQSLAFSSKVNIKNNINFELLVTEDDIVKRVTKCCVKIYQTL